MASRNRKKLKENPLPTVGICALLGVEGKYAKAHIIPRALTEPATKGEKFIEAGRGNRPIRRFSSWYDTQLVITEGEKILSEIDTFGISELRKHKLVWSSWEGKRKLKHSDYDICPDDEIGIGFRNLINVDSAKLRLFFLSILWRSLKATIKEFSYLSSEGVDMEALKDLLVRKDPGDYRFLPVVLDQLGTLGPVHNYSPTLQENEYEQPGGAVIKVRFFRIYMQGITAHIYIEASNEFLEGISPMIVGAKESLLVITRKFEKSWQFEALWHEIKNSSAKWPEKF